MGLPDGYFPDCGDHFPEDEYWSVIERESAPKAWTNLVGIGSETQWCGFCQIRGCGGANH